MYHGRTTPAATSSDAGLVESYRATAIAAGALTAGPFLQEALRHLGRLSGSEHCSILLVEDGHLRGGAAYGLPPEYVAAIDGVAITATAGSCGAAASTGLPQVTEDILTDPRWAAFRGPTEAAGLRSCASVPIVMPDGRVLGTFASYGREPGRPSPDGLSAVQEYAPIVALGLESIRRQRELARNYESIVLALTSALDSRDEYTGAHSSETAALAARVGARLGLDEVELETLARVAVLHDIGKLGIPTEILVKPRPLTVQEWEVMRRHPLIGERILGRVPFLEDVARAVRHEHERWDGMGYPDGLAGERIPLASRIVFACDGYHAMTSDRPYRTAMAIELACAELREHAGAQFDPGVVAALLDELGEPAATPALAGHVVRALAVGHALDAIARQAGAADLFVLRPIGDDAWRHLDGVGRGSGWAGNVEVHGADEPHVRAAVAGHPAVVEAEDPVRILGPYYARSAAVVLAPRGELVVFGQLTGGTPARDHERLCLLAERAAHAVSDVPPAKRLEDELEVLEAVRAVTTVTADALPAALAAVAECAAAALSCEFAAVATVPRDGSAPVTAWAGPGWSPVREELVLDAMGELVARRAELPLLTQDTAALAAPLSVAGFGAAHGITALQALPVGVDAVAVLLVAHASTAPRGFTVLCRRVAGAMADAAEAVIRRAVAQERLAAENQALAKRVDTDALTGVLSRSWWEDRLARHPEAGGRSWSVVVVDLDGLKALNDSQGHRVGDDLLRACARMLEQTCRAGDRVARIGGDEFVVLLQDAGPEEAARWCARLLAVAERLPPISPGITMTFSAGWGSTAPGSGLYAALAEADERMYEDKRSRRRRLLAALPVGG